MSHSLSRFTGLVVEDEWLLRLELVDELRAAGWNTMEAGTGETAMDILEKGDPIDFLITDIRLPGAVDGWQVAQAFRKAFPGRPVIYVSANPDLAARRVPDSVFLGKPCDMQVLLKTCARLVTGESG